MNNISKAFLGFGSYRCPFSLLFKALEGMIMAQVRATATLEKEMYGKLFPKEAFELVNHKTNFFARNQK